MSLYKILHLLSSKTGLEFKPVENYISVRPIKNAPHAVDYHLPSISSAKKGVPAKITACRSLAQNSMEVLIHGKVTNEQGEILVGVTVGVKGTDQGTVTDSRGRFSLNVPDNAVLVISYLV
jgi:hypothetical protein